MPACPLQIDGDHGRAQRWPLHDRVASRTLEAHLTAGCAPHALMQRAGLAAARLALALVPHAGRIWIAAGPGNNGGDGCEAAFHLQRAGKQVSVSLLGDAARRPADAAAALARAQAAGVAFTPDLPSTLQADLVIDALLGLGSARAPQGALAAAIGRVNGAPTPRLALDLPSGLDPDTGALAGTLAVQATDTLALLSLKPGLFTGAGRAHAGRLWFDALGAALDAVDPCAWLSSRPTAPTRRHTDHKGHFGDITVVGGAAGMTGAAWLAACAALAAGAGRVYLALLDSTAPLLDATRPELMHRPQGWQAPPVTLAASTIVCGCGGGEAVRSALPPLLSHSARLLLDADALNAIATDSALQQLLAARAGRGLASVLTPHPLEAARLLGSDAAAVQADRLRAAQTLADRYGCVVVLKGSGTVIAAPGRAPTINPTGNARLASAGTGDVLAGWIGGRWAARAAQGAADAAALAFAVSVAAVWEHGHAAEGEAGREHAPLRAGDLVERLAAAG